MSAVVFAAASAVQCVVLLLQPAVATVWIAAAVGVLLPFSCLCAAIAAFGASFAAFDVVVAACVSVRCFSCLLLLSVAFAFADAVHLPLLFFFVGHS